MNKSPLKQVQERFENKDKLVAAVKKLAIPELWLDRVNEGRGLESVPNAKLLRLHDALQAAQEKFGSRAKLIDAILTLQKRTKDQGYRQRLETHPLPRLLDIHAASARRAKSAASETKASASKPAAKKSARSKRAQAKARQAARA
jgi:hypothetical protein